MATLYSDVLPVLDRYPSLGQALRDSEVELCLASQMDNAHAYLGLSPYL